MNGLAAVVMDAPPRPAHGPRALTAASTFAWRVALKVRHVPELLTDVTLTPIMFTLMFTFLFGGALAGSTTDYAQVLLPGILVQTVVFSTAYTATTLVNDVSKGVFDRFRTLPVWRPAPIVGALIGDSVRYLIASAVVVGLGLVLGFRPAAGVVGVLLAVLLLLVFAFGLGWAFATLGLLVRSTNAVMGVSMTVLFPLTFVSNVYVDPRTMPGWLEAFAGVNPISHLVTAVRGLMAGTPVSVLWVVLASAVLVAVFAPLAMRLYRLKP